MNKEADPIDGLLLKYPAFLEVVEILEECFASASASERKPEPWCFPLVGDSGVGKTTVVLYFKSRHPDVLRKKYVEIAVLFVRVPKSPTIRSFVQRVLKALGDPYWYRGTLGMLTGRVVDEMKKHKVRVMVLNDFQFFLDTRYNTPYEVADYIKGELCEPCGISVVAVGLKEGTLNVIRKNRQLDSLFMAAYELRAFEWNDSGDRTTFRGMLRKIRSDLKSHYDFPDIDGEDLSYRLWYASYGIMRYLMKIIRGACAIARLHRTRKITIEMLSKAYLRYVRRRNPKADNPITKPDFNWKTAPEMTRPVAEEDEFNEEDNSTPKLATKRRRKSQKKMRLPV